MVVVGQATEGLLQYAFGPPDQLGLFTGGSGVFDQQRLDGRAHK